MIGIAISTYQRPEVFAKTYAEMKKYLPPGAELVVVSDYDENPPKEADYVFPERAGIPRVKNKCLELLIKRGCDELFLFDSDCFPITKDWYVPYVESPEPHLSYIFKNFADTSKHRLSDCNEIYRDDKHVAYSHVRGCMLYFNKVCMDKVGGFNTKYEMGMFEHGDLTNRIHNVNLTTFRVMDVVDSNKLIYSMDEYQEVSSSIEPSVRAQNLRTKRDLYTSSLTSVEYIDYREHPTPNTKNGVVICNYFTKFVDVQRNENWKADEGELAELIKSMKGQRLIILNDCFPERVEGNVEWVRVESIVTPYFQRWLSPFQWLRDNPHVDNVFIVDATDVRMLKNPFNEYLDPTKLYVGDEPATVGSRWMLLHSNHPKLKQFIRSNSRKPLLNCGVVGGSREIVMSLISDIYNFYFEHDRSETVEMGVFNYLLYTKYAHRVVHNRKITTVFKKLDYDNKEAWFAHK